MPRPKPILMHVTAAQFMALPAEDRLDPSVRWVITTPAADIQRDYDPCQFGTSARNYEIAE